MNPVFGSLIGKFINNPLRYCSFDVDTTYGDVYRLNKSQKIEQPPTEKPVTQVIPTPAVVGPKTVVVDRSAQYNQQTNKSLDTVFKNEMQK